MMLESSDLNFQKFSFDTTVRRRTTQLALPNMEFSKSLGGDKSWTWFLAKGLKPLGEILRNRQDIPGKNLTTVG
jgi:hypothetical protein